MLRRLHCCSRRRRFSRGRGAGGGPPFVCCEFDAKAPVTLKGTVTQMDWVNPHSWIHLEVEEPDGSDTTWMIEGGTPNTLLETGLHEEFAQGRHGTDRRRVPAKDGTNRANGRDLFFRTGKRLFLGSAGTGAPEDGKEPAEK